MSGLQAGMMMVWIVVICFMCNKLDYTTSRIEKKLDAIAAAQHIDLSKIDK